MMGNRPQILIVDDERKICRSLEILLQEEGPFDVLLATDFYEALEQLKHPVDLVLTDLSMPGKNGMDLLRAVKQEHASLPVILMTAYSTVDSAISAMKEGAFDYIVKPFDNDRLITLIRKALPNHNVAKHFVTTGFDERFGDLIGKSQEMQNVYFCIQRAAETDSTVLIFGESGTGKELVARAIHYSGNRKSKPFIAFNCAAVPETLLESELFGHERGAFSGAVSMREGRFELASFGTLFLDEIGEMSPALQVKLLRIIQEKAFERVGGKQTIRADVRIIAATNRDLQQAVRNGRFREDLYYRLNVVNIQVPTLRERKKDIPLLLDHFLVEKSRKLDVSPKQLSSQAREWLETYDYPGNVRELENIVERAIVISRSTVIEKSDLPIDNGSHMRSWEDICLPIDNGMELLEKIKTHIEKDVLQRALLLYSEKSNTELARILGTSRRVLESRLKLYQLQK